jgi:LAO/AO transport system kinase
VVRAEAIKGQGIPELAAKLDEHRAFVEAQGALGERRRRNLRSSVLAIATARLRRALERSIASEPEVQALLDEVVERRLDPASAADAILARGAIDARVHDPGGAGA